MIFSFMLVLIAFSISVKSVPQALLTSDPSSLDGIICPTVEITCTVQDLPTLRWFSEGVEFAIYTHVLSNTFPPARDLESALPGINIQVINAVTGTSPDFISAISVLTTNNATLLRGESIQCGSNVHMSEAITVRNSGIRAPPTSPTSLCAIHLSSGGFTITLQWSPAFNSHHEVERYQVTMIPGSSNCSSDRVFPGEDYSCSGLDLLKMNNSFTVSAINCGDQEGTRKMLNFDPHNLPELAVPGDVVSKVVGIYAVSTLNKIEIKWMNHLMSSSGRVQCSSYHNPHMNGSIITLHDSSGGKTQKFFTANTSDCESSSTCSTSFFVIRPASKYFIQLSSLDVLGRNSPTFFYPNRISGFSHHLLIYDLNMTNGAISALCLTPRDVTHCSIQFSTDPSYADLSSPTVGPTNTLFYFTFMEPTHAVYYHQASVVVNSTLEIIVRSSDVFNFAHGEGTECCNRAYTTQTLPNHSSRGVVMLKVYQLGLLGLLFGVLLLGLFISIGVAVCNNKVNKSKSQRFVSHECIYTPNALSSPKATQSSYQDVNPTPKSYNETIKDDIVYDEIPESLVRLKNTTAADATKSVGLYTMQLTVNSAYHTR